MIRHIGSSRIDYDIVHEGYGFVERNETGDRILKFLLVYELV